MNHVEQQERFEELMSKMLWAGELKVGPSSYTPPPVPWRKRVWRAITTFIWAYAPRVHIGPCCREPNCYC